MRKIKIPAEILGTKDGCPIVACKATWDVYLKYWSLTFNCPWCGREHRHGGNSDKIPNAGHRATHCSINGKLSDHDYILRVVETVGEWTPVKPRIASKVSQN